MEFLKITIYNVLRKKYFTIYTFNKYLNTYLVLQNNIETLFTGT